MPGFIVNIASCMFTLFCPAKLLFVTLKILFFLDSCKELDPDKRINITFSTNIKNRAVDPNRSHFGLLDPDHL